AQDLRHRKTRVVWRHEYRLMAALRPDVRIRSGDRTGSVLRARPALDQLAQALADAAEQRRLLRRCGRRGHPRLLAGGRRGHRLGLLLRLRLRPGPRCTRRRGAGFGAVLRRPAFVLPAAFDLLALGVDATTAATTTTLARCALSVGAGDFSRSGGSRRGGCRRRWRRHVRGGRIIGRGHVRTRLARLARTALGPTLGAAARSAGTAATLATAAAAAGILGGTLLARLAEDLAHALAGFGLELHAFARLARQRGQELGAH